MQPRPTEPSPAIETTEDAEAAFQRIIDLEIRKARASLPFQEHIARLKRSLKIKCSQPWIP